MFIPYEKSSLSVISFVTALDSLSLLGPLTNTHQSLVFNLFSLLLQRTHSSWVEPSNVKRLFIVTCHLHIVIDLSQTSDKTNRQINACFISDTLNYGNITIKVYKPVPYVDWTVTFTIFVLTLGIMQNDALPFYCFLFENKVRKLCQMVCILMMIMFS